MLENSMSGQLRNLSEDPDVYWDVGYRVDYGAQELHHFREEHDDEPGVSFFLTNPQKKNGEPFWTLLKWLESMETDQPIERGAPEGSRAPSPEELEAMRARRAAALHDDDENTTPIE